MFFGHQYFVAQQHQEDENLKIISSVLVRYLLTLNSHEWPGQNFSLQYQYNINQISDKYKEKYKFGDNKLIQY